MQLYLKPKRNDTFYSSSPCSYQCEWVSIERTADPDALRCLYTAPEIRDPVARPLTPAADWWSVGVILFELASGHYFVEVYPSGLRAHTPVEIPRAGELPESLVQLIEGFLQPLPECRLGAGTSGSSDVMRHEYFRGAEWDYTGGRKIT